MKKLILLMCFCLSASITSAASLNVISLHLLYGGLRTPNKDMFDNPALRATHSVGGLGFGLGLARYFPENWMRLPDNLYFGLEADYNLYANNTYSFLDKTRNTYTSNSLSGLGVLKYIFDNNAVLLGKAGAARVSQTLESSGTKTPLSKFRPQIQLGAGYIFNKHFQTNILYNYISGSHIEIGTNKKIATVSSVDFVLSLLF